MSELTEHREQKFRKAISQKQPNITLVFDNVIDPHNVYACLRTAEAIGIVEVFIINTGKIFQKKLKEGKRSGASAKKWIHMHYFTDYETCFEKVKENYSQVLGTYLGMESKSVYDLNLTNSIALVFGNEQFGLSEEVRKYCDGFFLIPQMGMIESLNISVACAVTLYEAYRQRNMAGMYLENTLMTETKKELMYKEWIAKKEEIKLARKTITGN